MLNEVHSRFLTLSHSQASSVSRVSLADPSPVSPVLVHCPLIMNAVRSVQAKHTQADIGKFFVPTGPGAKYLYEHALPRTAKKLVCMLIPCGVRVVDCLGCVQADVTGHVSLMVRSPALQVLDTLKHIDSAVHITRE